MAKGAAEWQSWKKEEILSCDDVSRKAFWIESRIKVVLFQHVMTFGSIPSPPFFFAIRFVFVEMGVGSFPRRHSKAGEKSRKRKLFSLRYSLQSEPVLNEQNSFK